MRIEIPTPSRQLHGLNPNALQDRIKARAELCIAIAQQIPTPIQESILRVAHIAGHLFHPGRVRPGSDSSDTDLPGGHPHKRQHSLLSDFKNGEIAAPYVRSSGLTQILVGMGKWSGF
jgi:hypothetical protein